MTSKPTLLPTEYVANEKTGICPADCCNKRRMVEGLVRAQIENNKDRWKRINGSGGK